MLRLQKAVGLRHALRALAAACCESESRVLSSSTAQFSTQIEPAATYTDIADEWYLRQRKSVPLGSRIPHAAAAVLIAPSAVVVGDVDLYDRACIWYGAVLRGDLNNITIGPVSNVQDRTVIHAARSSPTGLTAATLVGKYVTIGPNCVLRSCRVEDYTIIGAGSVLLEGSMVEAYSILEPGSVLPPAKRIPTGEVWAGNPAKFVRKVTEDERDAFKVIADNIRALAWQHMSDELPHGVAWRKVEEWREEQVKQGEITWGDLRRQKYQLRVEQEQAAKNADM